MRNAKELYTYISVERYFIPMIIAEERANDLKIFTDF